jgi:hypothetical protein
MTALSKSQPNNITSPNGNSLAVYVDGDTGVLMLKDIYGKIQPLANYLTKVYGSFNSNVTQTASQINTPKAMNFENTDSFSSGASIVSNSRITVAEAGVYNLQFSAQLDRVVGTGTDFINIWIRIQSIDVPNTNTVVTISGNANQSKLVASWNFYVNLLAGQYVELMYSVTDLQINLIYAPASLTVPHPATPSIIATIEKVN